MNPDDSIDLTGFLFMLLLVIVLLSLAMPGLQLPAL